jgi:hypothetical protein
VDLAKKKKMVKELGAVETEERKIEKERNQRERGIHAWVGDENQV